MDADSDAPSDDRTARVDPLIGTQLGEYRVLRRVGSGGMGIVYEGVQPLIAKRVAIKVLRHEVGDTADGVMRFIEEARTVNSIRRHVTADVFSIGQLPDGRHYFVMEFLQGESLYALIERRKRLPVDEALRLVDGVLEVLSVVHQAGVIHRDLKLSNIFLEPEDRGAPSVKVLDFGLAKRSTGEKWDQAGTAGAGTPDFMSPEQIKGVALTPAADLYAVGGVAFELLVGRPPFADVQPGVPLMQAHLQRQPPRPSDLVRGIPPAVDAFVLWLLAKEPEQRPGSAEMARAALRKIVHDKGRGGAKRSARAPAAAPSTAPERPSAPPAPDTPVSAPHALLREASSAAPERPPEGGRGAPAFRAVAVVFGLSAVGIFAALWLHGPSERAASPLSPVPVAAPDADTPVEARTLEPHAADPKPAEPKRPHTPLGPRSSAPTVPLAPGMGRLVLRVPAGYPELEASVDGQSLGSTPRTLELPAGRHLLSLSNPKARIEIPNYPVELTAGRVLSPVPWLLEPRAHGP